MAGFPDGDKYAENCGQQERQLISNALLDARELALNRFAELLAALDYSENVSIAVELLDGIPGDDSIAPSHELTVKLINVAHAIGRTTAAMKAASEVCTGIKAELGQDPPRRPGSNAIEQVAAAQANLADEICAAGHMLGSVIERSLPAAARMGTASSSVYMKALEQATWSASELHRNMAVINSMLGRFLRPKGGAA